MFKKKEAIEQMILSYLEQYPEAADTIEGITKFWMQKENAEIAITKVSHTLRKMVKKGLIRIFQSVDGTLYYKLRKDHPKAEQTV